MHCGAKMVFAGMLCSSMIASSRLRAETNPITIEACASAAENGQRARQDGKLLEARDSFDACAEKTCPSAVRMDCDRWRSELEQEIPTVVFRATDVQGRPLEKVRVLADGRVIQDTLQGESVALDPGPHELRFETPSGEVHDQELLLSPGERGRIVAVSLPAPRDAKASAHAPAARALSHPSQSPDGQPGSSNRTLGYVFGALGAVSLGVFAYFEVRGQQGYENLKNSCGRTGTCSPEQVSPVRTDFVVAGAALAVAAVSAGLATWQFLSTPDHRHEAGLTAGVIPGGAFASLRTSF